MTGTQALIPESHVSEYRQVFWLVPSSNAFPTHLSVTYVGKHKELTATGIAFDLHEVPY